MSRSAKKKYIATCMNPAGTKGTDYIAAGGTAKIVQTSELSVEPFAGDEIDRNLDDGSSGNSPVLLVGTHVTLSFNVEVAGSGGATTALPYGDLLKICGYGETIAADHVLYERLAPGTDPDDATIYYYDDGVLHKITGAQGNLKVDLKSKALGQFPFEITGKYGGVVSELFVSPTFPDYQDPLQVGAAYTQFTLDGSPRILINFEANAGNEVNYLEFVGKNEVVITDWSPEGSIAIEADPLADFDPFAIAESGVQMPVEIVHGVAGGNRITIASTAVQLGRPKYGEESNIRTYELPLRYIDDFTIKVD